MGKITIDEMHNSLFDYAQAVSDESLTTENKTIVGAINEIYGKRLIADSIGEPLNNTDTFTKMSDDINNLLSTFKTNIMNAGIVVESSDKFKQLIEKIKGLTEGEGNKGIQFAEGVCDNITIGVNTATNWTEYIFEQDFGFIPSRIIFQSESTKLFALNRDTRIVIDSHYHYSEDKCWYMTAYNSAQGLDNYRMYISNISSTGFSLFIKSDSSCFFNSNTWYAIGVGEEDTTLRDSLASILEDEGVSVTEEDDMASLITKVDEEFDNKNITDFSIGTQKLTWTVYSNEWIELSLNHSCGKIPKLVSIGFFDYKTELSNKYHTDENNYAVHKPTGLTNIYHFYISSITNDTIFLKMRHSNFNSGSSTHGVTAHYVLVY